LIIDKKEVWHLGASINFIGKKDSMINKIVDKEELQNFLDCYKDWWQNGILIT